MAEVPVGAPAPDVPVAPAVETAPTPETTADQVTEAPAGSETPEAPVAEKMLPQSEVDRIVAKRVAQESRKAEKLAYERAKREAAERELEQLRAERNPQHQPQGEPKLDDFKDVNEFIDARTKWILKQERESWQRETAQQSQARMAAERAAAVQSKLASASEKYPDFEEVALADHVPITEPMAAFIAESDMSGEVAYYLGSHIDEARKIAGMSPVRQVIALRDLESKISAPPKPTQTPPPIVPNSGKTTVSKDPSQMTDKEFAAWRRAQIAQRGNR